MVSLYLDRFNYKKHFLIYISFTFLTVLFPVNSFSQNEELEKLNNEINYYKSKKKSFHDSIFYIEQQIIQIAKQIDSLKFFSFSNTTKTYESSTITSVKLKNEPSVFGKAISLIPRDKTIEIIDYIDGYLKVKVENEFGYILASLVKDTEELQFLKRLKMNEQELKTDLEIQKDRKRVQNQIKEEREKLLEKKEKRLIYLTEKFGRQNALKIIDNKISLGMTKEMVRESWGGPKDINRTVGSWGIHEQWVYHGNSYLYFEDGILTSWQD